MVSDKKLQEKIKWFPHEGQKPVIACEEREIIIVAGRRWGKSAVSGYLVVKTFLEKLILIRKGEIDSVKIWIVAPTYELANKVFEYVIKFLLAYDKRYGQFIQNRPTPAIQLSERIWIQCMISGTGALTGYDIKKEGSEIIIKFSIHNNLIKLVIEDNGIGIEKAKEVVVNERIVVITVNFKNDFIVTSLFHSSAPQPRM